MKTLLSSPSVRLVLFVGLSLFFAGCSRPHITTDQIDSDIVGHTIKVRRGTIFVWTFDPAEPRLFHIVSSTYTRKTADIVIDMETDTVQHDEALKGQIRLHYEWVDGRWSRKKFENINFFPVVDHGPFHRTPRPADPQ
jgi:hypothetical protein